ncbi:MAG: enoyl-CoA hydratase [Betaproteobacteria bacterium]|nr:MAG: enoyl-CoA hydratase [Betaproteobacteria bacterium]
MQNSSGNGTVLWGLDKRGVASVTLNRPQVNNAYNGDLIAGVHEAMDALGAAKGVRVVVLQGNGKHFQAGADLAWISAVGRMSPEENDKASRATGELVRRLDALPLPTVALVQGGCFGGGTGIVAACDIVVAGEDAMFAITETRWGLMAGIILPQLVQAIGLRALRRYALTGERFDAHEARRIGLAHQVCAMDKLAEVGAQIVDALLMNAPNATAATKTRSLQLAGAVVEDTLFNDLVREHAATRQLAEAVEGLASFKEKRKPSWYPAVA